MTSNVNINSLFVVFITLGIFLFPAIPVGSGDINLEEFILLVFFLVYFLKNNIRIEKKFLFVLIFIVFETILLFYSHNIEWLIEQANSVIPVRWHQMYGKREIVNFYKPIPQSLFTLIHILENFFIFAIAIVIHSKKYINKKIIYYSLFIMLLVQLIVSIIQFFIFNTERAYGLTGNAQAVGVVVFTAIILLSDWKNKFIKPFIFIIGILLIFLSGTKSSIVTYLVLCILLYLSNVKLTRYAVFFSFFFNILFSVFLLLLYKDLVLAIISTVFNSSFSMNLRFLMWGSSFFEVFNNSPILGTWGRITEFPDNIIWYFLVPYGLLGLSVIIFFFYKLLNVNSIKVNLLIFIFFFQGFSYYGYMVNPVSYLWWFALGWSYSEMKKRYLN